MTEIQQKLVEMLAEMDTLCTKNHIQYFLYGSTALFAKRSGEFEGDAYSLSVVMTATNLYKFIECFEKEGRDDRYLESMLNCGRYPRVSMQYGNRNTLDFDTGNFGNYEHHGLYITIEILRKKKKNKYVERLSALLEKAWEIRCVRKNFTKKTYITSMMVGCLAHLFGEKRFAKWLFHFLVNPSGSGDKYYVKRYYSTRKYYPVNWFEKAKRVSLEGQECNIPWVYTNYFQAMFGKNWINKSISVKLPNPAIRMIDANLSYETYLKNIRETSNIDLHKIWKLRRNFVKKYSYVANLNTEIRNYWPYLFAAGERYNMWEYYQPKKLELQELYRSEDVDRLREVLLPYEKMLRQYNKQGIGFCFDKQVFQMLEYCMIRKGQGAFIQSVKKKVPKKHWKTIQLVDYNGNPIKREESKKGMREANTDVVPAILAYLRRDVGNCVYMYIDISKYGLDNPNMKVWYDTDKNGINLVVMKYYDSISVYSHETTWNEKEVYELINREKVSMVSGQQWIIEKLYPHCEENYNLENGYVFRLTDYRKFENVEEIEIGTVEDTHEIAELICSNESIGGYYEVDNLASQLAERIETGIGRSLVIRKKGKIVAHIATYAEYEKIAVTAGLIAKDDETNVPYGTILESRLVFDLLEEGFEIYTFVTEKRRARFFTAMGCQEYGRYGKMTLKD